MSYTDKITKEIKSNIRLRESARCAPTKAKLNRLIKLYRYQSMSIGAFKLARIFKAQ